MSAGQGEALEGTGQAQSSGFLPAGERGGSCLCPVCAPWWRQGDSDGL